MKKMVSRGMCLVVMAALLCSFNLPQGWFAAGNNPKGYEMGIDPENGKDAVTIKSIAAQTDGFGTLMQTSAPGKFLGKRVRMTGMMKSKNVTGWAGLWFRVDASSQQTLTFDNMENRAVKGTTDWKKYEIVLDVPQGATLLAFGALLAGSGQVWFDQVAFEIVDNSVPTTNLMKPQKSLLPEPTNLDFSKVEGGGISANVLLK